MMAQIFADLIVVLHLAFILFVVFGGLIALKWKAIVCIHIPCAIWGVVVELFRWVCPLTPLENRFRRADQEDGAYSGGSLINTSCRLSTRKV